MMRIVLVAAALSTVSAAAAAPAEEAPAATSVIRKVPPPTPERLRIASDIAEIAVGTDLMMAAVLAGWDAEMNQERANMEALDGVAPGLSARISDRGKAELIGMMRARLPQLQQKVGGIYAANATDVELQSILSFVRSPAGQQFVRALALSDSGYEIADDAEVSVGELAKVNRKASLDALQSLSADHKVELIKFSVSPGGRAMKGIGEKVQPVLAEWMTSLMTDYRAQIEPIIEQIVIEAVQKQGKK